MTTKTPTDLDANERLPHKDALTERSTRRRRFKTGRSWLVLLLALAVILASCGSSDEDADAADEGAVEVDEDAETDQDTVEEPEDEDEAEDDPVEAASDNEGREEISLAVAEAETEDIVGGVGQAGSDAYLIDLEAGATVVVTVIGDGEDEERFDPTTEVLTPNEDVLAFNDDAPSDSNLPNFRDSQLAFTTTQAGIHQIQVGGFASDLGTYTLTIDRTGANVGTLLEENDPAPVDGSPATNNVPPPESDAEDVVTLVAEDAVLTGSLDDPAGFDRFVIPLNVNDEVSVVVESTDGTFDPSVEAFDITGSLGVFDDSNEPGIDTLSSVVTVNAFSAGPVTLDVSSFAGASSGEYTVTVFYFPGEGDLPLLLADPIESIQGFIETEAIDLAVDLDSGEEVVITVEARNDSGVDPIVSLLLDGREIGRNDDADDSTAVNSVFDSQLIVTADTTGRHTIRIERFGVGQGDFELTVERR